MSSSLEFSESGRFPGQKLGRSQEKSSNFTQTCSLLSQYLKEKSTFGDLSLGMTRGSDVKGIPETSPQTETTMMNLFPVPSKLGEVTGASTRNKDLMMSRNLTSMDLFPQKSGLVKEEVPKMVDSSSKRSEPETAHMTIFYAGQVIVFNNCPADKAKEIMLLASNGSTHNLGTYASTSVQKSTEPTSVLSIVSKVGSNMVQEHIQRPLQPMATDLPRIARKASLTRFLEKRKERMTAQAPYPTSNSRAFPPKPAENRS